MKDTMRCLFFRFTLTLVACGLGANSAHAGFPAHNVTVRSIVPIGDFVNNQGSADDCWGYVSPSGREYALFGLHDALGVVEVTDPDNPVLLSSRRKRIRLFPDSAEFSVQPEPFQAFTYRFRLPKRARDLRGGECIQINTNALEFGFL